MKPEERKIYVFIDGKIETIDEFVIYSGMDLIDYSSVPLSKYAGLPMFDGRYFNGDVLKNVDLSSIYGTYTLKATEKIAYESDPNYWSLHWNYIPFNEFPPEFKTFLLLNGWTL